MKYEIWDLANSRTAGAKMADVPKRFPKPWQLSDSDLWQLVLTPKSWSMSTDTVDYLDKARAEFDKRKVPMRFIISARRS